MSPSELTNTIEQFIVYIHRNEAHFTYIYVYHNNVSEADNIDKKPSPKCHFTYIFWLFLFRSGTLLTAGALTDHRLPATASNVCTTDARLGGVGRVYGVPFSHLFTELQISPTIDLQISTIIIQLEISPNRLLQLICRYLQ